jgi:hypothetical protein
MLSVIWNLIISQCMTCSFHDDFVQCNKMFPRYQPCQLVAREHFIISSHSDWLKNWGGFELFHGRIKVFHGPQVGDPWHPCMSFIITYKPNDGCSSTLLNATWKHTSYFYQKYLHWGRKSYEFENYTDMNWSRIVNFLCHNTSWEKI